MPSPTQTILAWYPWLFTSPDEVTTRATGQTDPSCGSQKRSTVCIITKPFSKVALHFSSPKVIPRCVAAHMGSSGTGLSSSGPGEPRPGKMGKLNSSLYVKGSGRWWSPSGTTRVLGRSPRVTPYPPILVGQLDPPRITWEGASV